MHEFDLLFCVVNSGQGSRTLRIAKHNGVRGGTIFLGTGIVHSRLLEILDLDDVKREIVMMVAERGNAVTAAEALGKELHFRRHNHGIAFTVPMTSLYGTRIAKEIIGIEDRVVKDTVYSAIFTVVDKGRGEDVVDASKAAGARGATIIHARGSGIHETEMLFAMQIEPEKDVVLVLAKDDIRDRIITAIRERLNIDEPGTGIVFTLAVRDTYGLSDAEPQK